MATGALIGGAVISVIGSKKQADATKDAATGQIEAADDQYQAILDAVNASREADDKRTAAESIADDALKAANDAFKQANEQAHINNQITSGDWQAANAERRNLELQNIALGAAERTEQIKRQVRANEIYEGRAGTKAAASGFAGGSSLDQWVDTIVATNASDVNWMVSAGESYDALATKDANLRYSMSEKERAASDRDALLGLESGQSQYEYYESQREADKVMREADRIQRDADRDYALASGDATRIGTIAGAEAAKDSADAGFISAIGGAIGGAVGIKSSYDKFGWNF